MRPHPCNLSGAMDLSVSRRHFLRTTGAGFGALALHSMLSPQNAAGIALMSPHWAPKAKSCFLFMYGGPSQLDLFDYKPELQLRDGQSIDNEFRRSTHTKAVLQASRRSFRQHGQSGLWCSDALPHLSRHMDKMAMIHSLTSDSFAHGSALLNMNTGRAIQSHPSLGAWISYGLGELNENLPAYVVMLDPRGAHHRISQLVTWIHASLSARNGIAHSRTSHYEFNPGQRDRTVDPETSDRAHPALQPFSFGESRSCFLAGSTHSKL